MKLEKISLGANFDPSNMVTTHEIFARRSETVVDEEGFKSEQKKFDDRGLFSPRIFRRHGHSGRIFLRMRHISGKVL